MIFAALDVKSGAVINDCKLRPRAKEFLKFLRQTDKAVPARRDVHLVLDNDLRLSSPEQREATALQMDQERQEHSRPGVPRTQRLE